MTIYIWEESRKTKEKLFELVKLSHINEKHFIDRAKKVAHPFDPKKWMEYLSVIVEMSKKPACPVCGSPTKNSDWTFKRNPTGLTCLSFKSHFPFLNELPVTSENILKYLGEKCPHGLYKTECPGCIEEKCQLWILERDKYVEKYPLIPGYNPNA